MNYFVNINKASSKVVLKIAKSLSKMPNFGDVPNILMCLLITLNKKYKHVRLRKKCEQHEEYYLNSWFEWFLEKKLKEKLKNGFANNQCFIQKEFVRHKSVHQCWFKCKQYI